MRKGFVGEGLNAAETLKSLEIAILKSLFPRFGIRVNCFRAFLVNAMIISGIRQHYNLVQRDRCPHLHTFNNVYLFMLDPSYISDEIGVCNMNFIGINRHLNRWNRLELR